MVTVLSPGIDYSEQVPTYHQNTVLGKSNSGLRLNGWYVYVRSGRGRSVFITGVALPVGVHTAAKKPCTDPEEVLGTETVIRERLGLS